MDFTNIFLTELTLALLAMTRLVMFHNMRYAERNWELVLATVDRVQLEGNIEIRVGKLCPFQFHSELINCMTEK